MYELNRARLVCIGPRGARYNDVIIDLAGAGDPIARKQQSLWTESTFRPSPCSLLLLENGGGKSVLLRLLFSVVLPGRRNTVGGGSLDSYVLDRDTGHVVIEWMHVESGDLLVTGKVFERRNRGNDQVVDAWYSFKPSAKLTLETLPVASEGRRTRLAGFKETVDEIDRQDPTTELVWIGADQSKWREHLTSRGIDPELFALQRRMNGDEGEAAKAFKFTSGDSFVDWLLDMTLDSDDLAAVVKNFDEWATNLAKRSQWLLEKDFLEGVVAGLEPLADAYARHHDAEQAASSAERAAVVLARALRRRHGDDRAAVVTLAEELEKARAVVSSRNTERDNARELVNEIILQTLRLELNATSEQLTAAREKLKVADLEMRGWEMMPAVESLESLILLADELAEQVASAESTAAPALRRRDRTAGQLVAKYYAEADLSMTVATGHDAEASGAMDTAAAADLDRTEAMTAAATTTERHLVATATVADAHQRLGAAAAEGTVSVGTTAVEVPTLADEAREEHSATVRRLSAAKNDLAETEQKVRTAQDHLTSTEAELAGSIRKAEGAATAYETVESEALRIGRLLAVRDVVGDRAGEQDHSAQSPGLSAGEVDDAAERILDFFDIEVDARTETIDARRLEHREDERVVAALGNGGLLPSRPEVDAAVAVLRDANVNAHPGWSYLAETAAAGDRIQLIRTRPDLADGVVVIDASQLPLAQQVLDSARLLPPAAIAVGSGAALLDRQAEGADGTGFVVEPSPAMYDLVAAEERREELSTQIDTRSLEMADLAQQLASVTYARDALRRWREANPPGRLVKLTEDLSVARAGMEAAQIVRDNANGALAARLADREEADIAVGNAVIDERQASDLARRLESLVELVSSAAEAQRSLPGMVLEIRQHNDVAEDAFKRRRRAEAEIARQTRLAEQARSQAGRHRAAAADVPSTSGTAASEVPGESLAQLKSTAEAAQQAYLAIEIDNDLRDKASAAARKVQDQRDELALRNPAHVAEARRLRATPAAADRASWNVAQANVRDLVTDLTAEVDALTRLEVRLDQKVEAAKPASGNNWTNLAPEWKPDTVDDGRVLEVRAQAVAAEAQARLETANSEELRIERLRAAAADAVHGINEALLPLTALVNVPEDAEGAAAPYTGDVDSAIASSARTVAALKDTAAEATVARVQLDETSKAVHEFANDGRYAALEAPLRRSVLQVSTASLAANAGQWAQAMRGRWASLDTDLENTNRHRAVIVDRLIGLVDKALKTISNAERLSRMPDDLGDWGGRRFLEIGFKKPDKASIAVRAGEAIDRAADAHRAAAGGGKSRNARRDGIGLLQETLHAAVPKGFNVTALKPDTVLRDERVAIEDMNDVFSGGQELTGAMIMYCVLAALNAHESGRGRNRHSGILFLDNPVGRANASYLIDMQQAVAKALGVQLIFTTGLTEDRLLASFPLWVRLRNDADYRAGLKYLKVAATSRDAMPAAYTASELAEARNGTGAPGAVTAATVLRKPQQSSTSHMQSSMADADSDLIRDATGRAAPGTESAPVTQA